MIILPGRPKVTLGRSQFWVPPPAPPLVLGIIEESGQDYSAWGQTSNINLPITLGVKSGDMLVLELSLDSDAYLQYSFNNYPAGWSLRGSRVRAHGAGATFVKVCDGTETTPVVFGISGSVQSWSYHAYRVEGAEPDLAHVQHANRGWDSSDSYFVTSTLTPPVDGCLLLSHVVASYGGKTWTVDGPYTETYDRTNGGATASWISSAGASYMQPTAAATNANHHPSATGWRIFLGLTSLRPLI